MSPGSLVRQLKAIQPSNIPMNVKLLNAKKDFYDYEANTSSSLYSKEVFLSAKENLYTAANIHCLTVKGPEKSHSEPLPKPKHLNQNATSQMKRKRTLQVC